jgi:hypothetical protein
MWVLAAPIPKIQLPTALLLLLYIWGLCNLSCHLSIFPSRAIKMTEMGSIEETTSIQFVQPSWPDDEDPHDMMVARLQTDETARTVLSQCISKISCVVFLCFYKRPAYPQ